VPRTIAMPTTPNFVTSSFRIVRAQGLTSSPFSFKYKIQEFDGVYWTADVSLPPMRRSTAVNWQSFLMQLKGQENYFKFADPDALANKGTYSTTHLIADPRINNTNVTLSFNATTSVITAGTALTGLAVGDFFHITGAINPENNGTHKITNIAGTNTQFTSDKTLVTESSTASCKVRQNVKGAEALSLEASTNSATGTIKVGDYLQIQGTSSTTTNPVQLVQVVEDATETSQGGSALNHFSVRIEPKLRSDFADGSFAVFTNPKGLFRLVSPEIGWSADQASNYGISFSCIEVI
jgi:hypothetical protein